MSRVILVTGAGGQLGTELQRTSWPEDWDVVAVGRDALDLRDTAAIARTITAGHAGKPFDGVINAAAYTEVDKAESESVAAWEINALAPAAFGEVCAGLGIPLVQVSTDYVFSGEKVGAWEVDDPVAPLGVYGASKLGGELAVRTSGARHVIVRTAWVVSAHGKNFVKTMLRLAKSRETLGVVDDQCGTPTSAADLADVLRTVLVQLVEDPEAPAGTFHFSNAGTVTWAGFAEEIFRRSGWRGGVAANVVRVTTADYPTPARRPANSSLSHTAIINAYGIEPRPWQDALDDILDEIIGVPQ